MEPIVPTYRHLGDSEALAPVLLEKKGGGVPVAPDVVPCRIVWRWLEHPRMVGKSEGSNPNKGLPRILHMDSHARRASIRHRESGNGAYTRLSRCDAVGSEVGQDEGRTWESRGLLCNDACRGSWGEHSEGKAPKLRRSGRRGAKGPRGKGHRRVTFQK